MTNVAVFEDHPIMLKSIKLLLENDNNIDLKFVSTNKKGLYTQLDLKSQELDIIILDMLANDVRGLEVYEYIAKKYPKVKQICFTSLSSPILVENLLSIGVKGYVNKNQDEEDLIEAIKTVIENKIYLPDDYDFLKLKNYENKSNRLTEREIQITQLISSEYTTNDIASQLKISVNTVENHRKNIFTKLDVKNVAGMVREAAKLGYLE